MKSLYPAHPEFSEDELFDDDDNVADYTPERHDPAIPGPSGEPPAKKTRTTATVFGDFTENDEDHDSEDDDLDDEDYEEVVEEHEEQNNKKKGNGKGKGTSKKQKSALHTRPTTWKKEDLSNPPLAQYVHQPGLFLENPYHYFSRFFSPELIKHIVYQTNLYGTQKDVATTFSTDESEILSFLAILLYMGVCNLPSLDDYWAIASRVPQVAEIMSSKRFKLLRRYIHFNDNYQIHGTVDRFYKVRPLFSFITKAFLNEPQTPKQSIDEVMVGYKGKKAGNLRQYVKNKPHKWGYKLFCRASDDGFVHDMILYQGDSTLEAHGVPLNPEQQTFTKTSQIVTVLASTMTADTTTAIFADNYFTSLEVIRYLQSINCRYTGTARDCRVGNPPLKNSKDMNKKSELRGSCSYTTSDDGILALRWKDTKVVTVLSTDLGVQPITKCLRYSKETKKKEEVNCPSVIKNYNAHMGGIDKSDMLVQLYRTPLKSKKWYMRLFAYCLDLSVCNAWLCYKRDAVALGETKELSLKDFRLELFKYASSQKPNIHLRSRSSNRSPPDVILPMSMRGHKTPGPATTVRFNKTLSHIPVYQKRLTCKLCSRQGHIIRTNFVCQVCKVHLCLNEKRNCFKQYHEPEA